ncbi:MAG: hypothetical protein WBQ94_03615 [Terracidiphilus sp.]
MIADYTLQYAYDKLTSAAWYAEEVIGDTQSRVALNDLGNLAVKKSTLDQIMTFDVPDHDLIARRWRAYARENPNG